MVARRAMWRPMAFRTKSSGFVAILLLACGGQPPPAAEVPPEAPEPAVNPGPAGTEPARGQLPDDVLPRRYSLTLEIDPDRDHFSGEVVIRARAANPRRVLWMHGRDFEVETARVSVLPATRGGEARVLNGQWENQADDDSFASLTLPEAVQGELEVRLRFRAPYNRALRGIYKVAHDGRNYVFTQMEPLSARLAFPGFDEPRFKTPFDVTLRVRPNHVAVANSSVRSEEESEGWKVVRFNATEPLPTYLIALAVGELDVVEAPPIATNAHRMRPLPFRGIAPYGRGAELKYAMENTPALLLALEEYFGMAYPYDKLDIVAVPDFQSGAMENAGLITFRDSILLFDEENLPTSRLRFWSYIMAHELAHQWFGNLVTMRWWDDLWLNEAFASWIEYRAVAEWKPDYEPNVELSSWVFRVMSQDSLDAARAIAQPIVSSHDIHNAFDGITYGKGAGVIAMFERWMGQDVFRRAVRRYVVEHRDGNATRDDLLRSMSQAAGRDIAGPFNTFLTQPGLPLVSAELSCEGAPEIRLQQTRYRPVGSRADAGLRWQIPVCVRYVAEGNNELKQICGLLESDQLVLRPEGCPRWIHPNAGGAGYYRWSLPQVQLQALMRRGLQHLEVAERLSLADSLRAAFYAGNEDVRSVLDALIALLSDAHHKVATSPLGLFEHLLANVVDESHAVKLRRRLLSAVRRDYRRLGWTERDDDDDATRLRRAALVPFVANVLEDRAARRQGAALGRNYIGESQLNADAVAADLTEAALRIAVQDSDAAFFEKAKSRLQSTTDGIPRRYITRALGAARDARTAEQARGLSLDDGLRVNEIYNPLVFQVRDRRTRGATWEWLKEHFDELVQRMPPAYGGYLPELMGGACDTATAADVQAFFSQRVTELPGGPRHLQSATETIRLCAAQADAQRDRVHQWLDR